MDPFDACSGRIEGLPPFGLPAQRMSVRSGLVAFLTPTPLGAVAMGLLLVALIIELAPIPDLRPWRTAVLDLECERALGEPNDGREHTAKSSRALPDPWRRELARRFLPECNYRTRYINHWNLLELWPSGHPILQLMMPLIGFALYYGLWQVLHARLNPLGRILADGWFQALGIIGSVGAVTWGVFDWTRDLDLFGLMMICHVVLLGAAAAVAVVRWGFSAR